MHRPVVEQQQEGAAALGPGPFTWWRGLADVSRRPGEHRHSNVRAIEIHHLMMYIVYLSTNRLVLPLDGDKEWFVSRCIAVVPGSHDSLSLSLSLSWSRYTHESMLSKARCLLP